MSGTGTPGAQQTQSDNVWVPHEDVIRERLQFDLDQIRGITARMPRDVAEGYESTATAALTALDSLLARLTTAEQERDEWQKLCGEGLEAAESLTEELGRQQELWSAQADVIRALAAEVPDDVRARVLSTEAALQRPIPEPGEFLYANVEALFAGCPPPESSR